MSLQLRHCPECGALQADVPKCTACGAGLGGHGGGSAAGGAVGNREILRMAGLIIAVLGGFVLFGIIVLSAISWLLR